MLVAITNVRWKIRTRETVKVNSTEKGEEFNSVLGKLGEVFVDHFQCALKDILHDSRNLIFHKRLSICVSDRHRIR